MAELRVCTACHRFVATAFCDHGQKGAFNQISVTKTKSLDETLLMMRRLMTENYELRKSLGGFRWEMDDG